MGYYNVKVTVCVLLKNMTSNQWMLSINNNHWQDIQIDIDIWQIAYHWQVFHIDQLHSMSVWYSTNNDVQLYRLWYIIHIPPLLYILPVVVILICNLFGVTISSMEHYSKLSPANIENLHLSQCQLCQKPPFYHIGGCHYDNLQCHHWRQSWHYDKSRFSVFYQERLNGIWPWISNYNHCLLIHALTSVPVCLNCLWS